MSLQKKIALRTERRKLRVRKRLASDRPRVSVFKSLRGIYAQIIDDNQHKTLASYSSLQLENATGDKKAVARTVGMELAQRAIAQGIKVVAFDRGPFRYHGRIQALAEGLREGGLDF